MEQPNREITPRNDETFPSLIARQAHKNAQMARQLSHEAMGQWEKALSGVLAIPAAVALSTAANALYVASFIERGFEAFQASAESIQREIEHQMRGYVRSGNRDWSGNRGVNDSPQSPS